MMVLLLLLAYASSFTFCKPKQLLQADFFFSFAPKKSRVGYCSFLAGAFLATAESNWGILLRHSR
jgi:hypothetical protein